MRYCCILWLLCLLASCSFFKKKANVGQDVVARVNDEYLYASDINSITRGLKGEDSLKVIRHFAENWVKKKLLLQKAQENIEEEDAGIARKIEDYRETLLLFEYEKALIDQKLDTSFSQQEMDNWYEIMKNDFRLETEAYLVDFIKLKKDAPDLSKARKWILNPKDEEDLDRLEGYSREFAVAYSPGNGVWLKKEKMLESFPLSEGDIQSLNSSKKYKEFKEKDTDIIWYIRVSEVVKKDEPAPLFFVREKIQKAIIEKRKMQLVERTYNKIYQDGMSNKSVEIYTK